MDLTPYVDNLRHELALAAAAGGADARAMAERLTAPLESAIRLALLDALSAAAAEITSDLAPGSVDLRLRGREPGFVVTPPPTDLPREQGEAEPRDGTPLTASDGADAATSRINFRLSERLKTRIEQAAGRDGLSVNTWLVHAATAALEPDGRGRRSDRRAPWGGQRYTGWAR